MSKQKQVTVGDICMLFDLGLVNTYSFELVGTGHTFDYDSESEVFSTYIRGDFLTSQKVKERDVIELFGEYECLGFTVYENIIYFLCGETVREP